MEKSLSLKVIQNKFHFMMYTAVYVSQYSLTPKQFNYKSGHFTDTLDPRRRRRRGHKSSTKVYGPANRSSKIVTDYGKYVHQT